MVTLGSIPLPFILEKQVLARRGTLISTDNRVSSIFNEEIQQNGSLGLRRSRLDLIVKAAHIYLIKSTRQLESDNNNDNDNDNN